MQRATQRKFPNKARFTDRQKANAIDVYDRGHMTLAVLYAQHEITWQDLEMWRADEFVKPHLYSAQDVREVSVIYYDFLTGKGQR